MDPLVQAQFFATTHHVFFKRQMYGALPYTHHLQQVVEILGSYGTHGSKSWYGDGIDVNEVLIAGWLHDIVEDTDVKLRDVEEQFGENVAMLVGAVTDEQGSHLDRKARKALTYPRTRAAGKIAVRLKLADRLANVDSGGSMLKKYAKEHEDFRRALFTEGENLDLWEELRIRFDGVKI